MAKEPGAKEALFCEYLKILHSPREAAARAGYPFPERSAVKLMKKAAVKRRIAEMNQKSSEAVAGLKRIAFGSVADAVWLCQKGECPSREELEQLDLYMISELKFTKGGAVEVKFFDRIKALDMLSAQGETKGGKAEPFFLALGSSAKQLASETEEQNEL